MRNGLRKRIRLVAPTSQLSVLVVGSLDGDEFAAARYWLRERALTRCVERVEQATTGASVFDRIELPTSPELIVLACTRRGQFSSDDIVRVKAACPLANVVALAGSWCGGPWRRAGDVLPGAWIVPWHQWRAWADFNLSLERRRTCPTWSLPMTTAADELAEFWSHHPTTCGEGLIAVDAADRDTAEAIADTLSLAGFATAWCADNDAAILRGAAGCVCDAAGLDERVIQRLKRLRDSHSQARIALLLNFPQIADVHAALAAGADLVAGKPFTVGEFLGQLGELISRPAKPRRADVAA